MPRDRSRAAVRGARIPRPMEVVRAHPTKNSPTWHALVGTGSIGSADLPPGARL